MAALEDVREVAAVPQQPVAALEDVAVEAVDATEIAETKKGAVTQLETRRLHSVPRPGADLAQVRWLLRGSRLFRR